MKRYQGRYALVQFCPVPERMEYLNVGLVLVVPELGSVAVRMARGHARIERVFGKQQRSYLDAVKASFESRLLEELDRSPDASSLIEFAQKRANDIRLSPLRSILISDPKKDFADLFAQLVGEEDLQAREPRVRRRLREAFSAGKVEQFLERPEEVALPEYGLKINVPFGYQNGCYNLIDGMRLSDNPSEGLREAGKRAMEGGLLWKHFEQSDACKRLIVVGDFSKQSSGFYNAVQEQFAESNVGLYRFDDLRPLFNDIQKNAVEHGMIHG